MLSREQGMLLDFLIAAHAMVNGQRRLVRDRSCYRDTFAGLTVVEPVQSQDGQL